MKDTKKTEFPGKMDKTTKRKYKTTYKMGYGKLKHVKMFENFDQSEMDEDMYEAISAILRAYDDTPENRGKIEDFFAKYKVNNGQDTDKVVADAMASDMTVRDAIAFASSDLGLDMNESKINETGEWSRDMDLQKVKGMTDDEIGRDDEASWIKALWDTLEDIKAQGVDLEVDDIKGFDKYQGPYAIVDFKKKGRYKVWTAEHDELFIEDWPSGNNDRGFVGSTEEIVNILA